MKVILNIIKWILILTLLIFALATFMGKNYAQTFVIALLVLSMAWWPKFITRKWGSRTSLIVRILLIIVLFISNIVFFKPEPKTSIYISQDKKEKLYKVYDQRMKAWPANTEEIYIQSPYGKVHVLAVGDKDNPPLMMIHAASMGAHSWSENLQAVIDHYRIYSFDNIGEGNKSQLDDALNYPLNAKEIADLYALLADSLGIESCPVFGSSNGGFVAQVYAYHYPDRVEKLLLFGPMGLTPLTGKSIAMLSIASMYPFDFIRNAVTKWALGDDEYVNQTYGDWFDAILKGTIPSVAMPVPMTVTQKKEMKLPVLLFLGSKDPIVGDAEEARKMGEAYPNIRIEVLESGHLIAVEQAVVVNEVIREFLGIAD